MLEQLAIYYFAEILLALKVHKLSMISQTQTIAVFDEGIVHQRLQYNHHDPYSCSRCWDSSLVDRWRRSMNLNLYTHYYYNTIVKVN